MDPNTLTLYAVAGGLNLALCLVLAVFAHFRPGTKSIRHWIAAIVVMAAGLLIGGLAEMLPRWTSVVVGNSLLLAAGPILYAGLSAHVGARAVRIDRLGWLLVAVAMPAFWYWGLVEPNGTYRSVAFSLVSGITNGRTALVLLRAALRKRAAAATWVVGLAIGAATIWMLWRAGALLVDPLPAAEMRGANPTTWATVFWYILIMALISICAMWLEAAPARSASDRESACDGWRATVGSFQGKLLLLLSAVVVQVVLTVGALGIVYGSFYTSNLADFERAARAANEAMAMQTHQVIGQVDTALQSVRAYLVETRSPSKTEQFIKNLPFDRTLVPNIYVIGASGAAMVAPSEDGGRLDATRRDYFAFHRDHAEDVIFIGPVERGQITGKFHFRVTRRISDSTGAFGGVVLATVDPDGLAKQFRAVGFSERGQMALLGTQDRKLRARVPATQPEQWKQAVASPLWQVLDTPDASSFKNTSPIDGVLRTYVFKRVAELPLVAVAGYADADLLANVHRRMRDVVWASFVVLGFSLVFASLLLIEAKRRDEQDRFMSMLSHELKTPLSVIRMFLGSYRLPEGISNRIERAVSDIRNVVERCLLTDKLQHGRVLASNKACNVADVFERIAETIDAPQRLTVAQGELPVCETDAQLLYTIVLNLVDNALKYGRAGSPIAVDAVAASRHRTPGIAISVANAPGPAGMPDRARVFSRYYREAAAHNKTGSGLGLHIASGMAEILGGTLSYVPCDDEVRFELWIPCRSKN